MGKMHHLLVEGSDDCHVIWQLCTLFGVPDKAFFMKKGGEGGLDEVIRRIPTYLKSSDLRALGIVTDANADPQSRWQSISNKLRQEGYEGLPTAPKPDGTILLQAGKPVVGVWIWPDNVACGILEDFLISLATARDSRLLHRASRVVDQIPLSNLAPMTTVPGR